MTAAIDLDHAGRDALRYCGGVAGASVSTVVMVDQLAGLGLLELREPGAWVIADRYRPTRAGRELLEQIGVRG